MTADRPPEVSNFDECWIDELAIRKYLDVKYDGQIARLAAMMAPKPESSDPEALAVAAIALNDAINAELVRQRESMVATMNYMTMIELLQRLGVPHDLYKNEYDEHYGDALIGPVFRRLRSMVDASNKRDARGKASIAGDLAKADARTKLIRPTLPCDLENALRYATDSPKVPWQILNNAFMDFIGIHWITTKNSKDLARDEETLKGKIRRVTARLAETAKKGKKEPATLTSRKKDEAGLKVLEAELGKVQEIRGYPSRFTPGAKAPDKAAEASTTAYEASRQNPKFVTTEQSLAWLSMEFHAFWQEHHAAYLKLHRTAEKAKKAKAAKNRAVAPKGPASREFARWLKLTGAFVKFLSANIPSSSNIAELIDTFADEHSDLSSAKARLKVKYFLDTLFLHAGQDFDGREILITLRKHGIKTLTADAVRACLDLMKSGPGWEMQKKLKKS